MPLKTLCRFTRDELIRIRMTTARECLRDAYWGLQQNHLCLAVDRAYFANFHSAAAALLWRGVERTRDRGVQSALRQYLLEAKLLEPEFGDIYRGVRLLRDQAEYQLFLKSLTVAETTHAVAVAERFVQRVERYLKEVGAIEETP